MTEVSLMLKAAAAGAKVDGDTITFDLDALLTYTMRTRAEQARDNADGMMSAYLEGQLDERERILRIQRDWADGQHDQARALCDIIEQSDLARIARGTRP